MGKRVAVFGIILGCSAAIASAQPTATIEELDTAGNPPGLEGTAGVFLRDQSGGGQHLVVLGGCTEDSLYDQGLVLSDVTGGFDNLSWEAVPVPGMGAVCEHTVVGPGDVAYLIGGYRDGFDTMRPMTEMLQMQLTGGPANPALETTTVEITCPECPEPRVGHAAVWMDSFEDCSGGAVLVAGGMNSQFEQLDDVWFFCTESAHLKADLGPYEWQNLTQFLMPTTTSDHILLWHPLLGKWVFIGTRPGSQSLEVWVYHSQQRRWEKFALPIGEAPVARFGATAIIRRNGDIHIFGGRDVNGRPLSEHILVDYDVRGFYPIDPGFPTGLANLFGLKVPSGQQKRDETTHALVYGGVESFSPRTLSDSTYLVTITGPELAADVAVPALARVRGAGAFFTSLMHLFNAGDTDLELEMVFTPRQGSGGEVTTVNHTVPAGVLQIVEDPLEVLFGFSGGAGRVGSLLITVSSGSADDLMVQTVVFARLDTGEEYGQFFPAMTFDDAITAGQIAYLNTTEDPVVNRVNVGLMALDDGTSFRVRPVDPLGNGLAAAMDFDLDLGGNTQINNIHNAFGLGPVADVVIEVEVVSGSGLSYASVLDGNIAYDGTSDPTTILPVLGGSDRVILLEIGSIQGLNEFSGSASITNYSNRQAMVRADFLQRGVGGVTASETLTIPAGDTRGFTDLAGDLFGVFGDVGTVVLIATNGTEIGATGREFAIFRNPQGQVIGTAGQLIGGQTGGDRLEPGRVYHFIGLRQAGSGSMIERSHIAGFNPWDSDVEITLRLYDGASGAFEGERVLTLGPETLIQVNNVIRQINAQHDDGEKRLEVEVDRRIYMNAFRVNIWGDPVTLNPFPG